MIEILETSILQQQVLIGSNLKKTYPKCITERFIFSYCANDIFFIIDICIC